MFPIVLVSPDKDKIQFFLDQMRQDKGIDPYYVQTVYPEKTEITIGQIRDLKKQLVTTTDKIRFIVIYEFGTAGIEAQNAFLKTLEENTQFNQFVLITKNIGTILSTIRSRSQIIVLENESGIIDSALSAFFSSIEKNADSASFLSSPLVSNISKDGAIQLIEKLMLYISTYKLSQKNSYNVAIFTKKLLKNLQLLQSNNLNPQLTIDATLLGFRDCINKS